MKQSVKLAVIFALSAACCAPLAAQDEVLSGEDGLAAAQTASELPGAPADDVQPPAAPAAEEKPLSQEDTISAEWKFFLETSADKNEDVLEHLLQGITDWVAHNPNAAGQYLKANLRYRLGDYKGAIIDLVHHFYEYPGSGSSDDAKKLFQEILDKKADKKMKPGLTELAAAVPAGDTAARLRTMLQKLPGSAGAPFYEPIMAQYREYLSRFPGRSGNDNVAMAAADMHLNMKEYLAARLGYEKVITMYPASPLIAKAKLFLAVILADNLKEYDRAIKVFKDITVTLPGTDQAVAAYARLPVLAEKQKQYQLAVDVYEEIIKLYPDKPEAYNAYVSEARVLREELDKFPEAVAVLNRTADKYKDARGVDALFLAAEICRKDLKDPAGEVKMYDRIAAEFKADPMAPKALMAAGEVYEKLKDFEKARNYYETVKDGYPEDAQAKKAQKRLDGLLAR